MTLPSRKRLYLQARTSNPASLLIRDLDHARSYQHTQTRSQLWTSIVMAHSSYPLPTMGCVESGTPR